MDYLEYGCKKRNIFVYVMKSISKLWIKIVVYMVDYTDSQLRRFIGHSFYRMPRFNGLFDNEVSSICKYLENPTRSGFWVLELNLNKDGEFKEFLKKQLSYQLLSDEKVVEDNIQSGEPQSTLPGLSEFDENNFNKLSFIFKLFHYLTYHDSGKEYPLLKRLSLEDIAFALPCHKEIMEKFSEAYDYFVQEINFDNFFPSIYPNEVFKIKDGFIISVRPNNRANHKEISKLYISFDPLPLEKMQVFLSKLELATNAKMKLVFSPEEKVLEPYFTLLNVSYNYIINEDKIRGLLEKSFRGYEDKNYEYCISNLVSWQLNFESLL